MEPLLFENDLVYFEKVKTKGIKINDILLIRKGQLFIHRVIYNNGQYLISKGDNNSLSDGKIRPSQILGRVIKVRRGKNLFKPEDVYLIQSSLYLKEVIKIKKILEENKIEYVFLKGLPLHFFFEGTHPKRLYSDCDILINKNFFLQAEKIFFSQGYKAVDLSLSKQSRSIKSKLSECSYQKIIQGFAINFDVHLEAVFMMTQLGHLEPLYPQKLIDLFTQELLKTKRTITINHQSFFILNTKYLILYLALHFFHHNFQGAFRLHLLDKIIRRSKLKHNNWQKVKEIINTFQLDNFISPVFFLLKKHYQTPLPRFINFKNLMNFKNLHIFDSDSRITSGVTRFKNIFMLSPYPLWKKLFIFTNLEVLYSIFFVMKKKLSYFLRVFLKKR